MGQCYSSKTAVLKTVKHDTNVLRIKRKLGDTDFTNIVDIIDEKADNRDLEILTGDNSVEHETIWNEIDTKASQDDIISISNEISSLKSSLDSLEEKLDSDSTIDLTGNLCENIDSSDDINATLREYVTPLRKTNGYQIISSTIGTDGAITRVNLNDLREISTNPLFDSCIINGDVVMKFPVLEVAPAIFNSLTVNGNLYIELPNAEAITKITNTYSGSGTITVTAPDELTIAIS